MADRKALCLTSTGLAEIGTPDRLILPGDPTANLHAVPKQYADRLVPYIPNNGNSMFASGGVETSSRFSGSNYASTSGQLWLSYFTAIASTPLTKLGLFTGAVAATGNTLARLAMFTASADDSITKVAQTASDNAIGASAYTLFERVLSTVDGFPSSYTPVPGNRYALGWLNVATTPVEIYGQYIIDGGTTPVPSRAVTAQTDIAASYTVAAMGSPLGFVAYLRARP